MMSSKFFGLERCPFCGHEAELRERNNSNPSGGKQYQIRCSNKHCICRPITWRVNLYEVVAMWNRRATR